MTAAEWIEFSSMASANSYTSFAILLTVASGYLAASYLIGTKLTKSQVTLANLVFIPAYLFLALNAYGNLADSYMARSMASASVPEIETLSNGGAIAFLLTAVAVYLGILIVCLKFMRDMRQAKE